MTAVQPSKVDMCRLLSDQPVGAIKYIDKEVNVKVGVKREHFHDFFVGKIINF